MTRFKDQVVIVTGASRGIGKGISQAFAQEGAKLVLVGRDVAMLKMATEELKKNDGEAIYVKADVSHHDGIESMVKTTINQYGKIDVLCHNAGIIPNVRLENMTLEEWQKVIDVNLTGTFLAVKACIPAMKAQGHGKIIVTSSISGPERGSPGLAHYTASKGGVAGFIKTAAIELAKYNININAVEPGTIMTDALKSLNLGPEDIKNMIRGIPLGRIGAPEDIAPAVLFLASKGADYITGQSLIIDGGQTLPENSLAEY